MRFLRKKKCTELNNGLRAVNYNPEKEKKTHKFLQDSDFVGHVSFCGFLAMTNMVNISSM